MKWKLHLPLNHCFNPNTGRGHSPMFRDISLASAAFFLVETTIRSLVPLREFWLVASEHVQRPKLAWLWAVFYSCIQWMSMRCPLCARHWALSKSMISALRGESEMNPRSIEINVKFIPDHSYKGEGELDISRAGRGAVSGKHPPR